MDDIRFRILCALLARFTPEDRQEEVLGDFEELFQRRMAAGRTFLPFIDAVSAMRRSRPARKHALTGPLLVSYLRQTIREWKSGRSFAVMNIVGLAVGLMASLLIGLYVHDEWRHDRSIPGASSIYRITTDEVGPSGTNRMANAWMPLVESLPNGMPATRYYPSPSLISSENGDAVQEGGFVYADSSFFDVFAFRFVSGSATEALRTPNALVLTTSAAQRWFGTLDVVGRRLFLNTDGSKQELVISAVIEDAPLRSHLVFDMIGNLDWLLTEADHMDSWYWPPVYTYVSLRSDAERASTQRTLEQLSEERMPQLGLNRTFDLQPFLDIWLRSDRQNEPVPLGSLLMMQVLMATAFLILLVACINFVNLMTAQGLARMQEASIRRAFGATRPQLAHQFLGTTLLSAVMASGLGVLGTVAALPWFTALTGRTVSLSALLEPEILVLSIMGILVIGLGTGAYPAVVLSRQTSTSRSSDRSLFRRGLIVFQFGIACSLVFASLVMSGQMELMMSDHVGFDREHVVTIHMRDRETQIDHKSVADAILRDPRVSSVTSSSGYPGMNGGIHDFQIALADAPSDTLLMDVLTTEPYFVETYGLELLAGRSFSPERTEDLDAGFIINQAAARHLGLTEPIGTELTLEFFELGPIYKTGSVIGLIRDFQYHSLRRETTPLLIHVRQNSFFNDFLSVRLTGNDVPGAMAAMESAWNEYNPERPFEYVFVDDVFDAMYRSEIRLTSMIRVFAGIGLGLSALGIFAVAAYSVTRRRREIGIRKVLGASTTSVIGTLSGEYAVLVVLACAISIPVTGFILQRWLLAFADRAAVFGPGLMTAVTITIVCGLSAVLFVIWRATRQNPAVTLRSTG